ncbi:MAG: Ig-like domain-containing protein [Actinobacteria bacterium]|nr:Ig-like domain-containing protein [Actinomycetota bacterium]
MVRATDTAGNADATPASYTWTVDTTPPNTSITSNPASLTNSTGASFSFTATETATFQCQLDGGGYGACTSPRNYTSLTDGSHTFDVRATDTAGNVDATPASYSWTVDTTVPDTSITVNPAALTTSTDASFSFTATEVATFQCQLDGGGYGACTSPRGYTSLADGSHTFMVRASDAAGNTDATPASVTWTIDTAAPNTTITSNPAALSGSTGASFSFTATETATFQCQLDGGGYGSCTSPRVYSSLADGSHTFDVRATDTAGNTDATLASYGWTIDATVPNVQITSPAGGSTLGDTTPDVSFTASDANGVTVECKTDGGPWTACGSPYTTPALADGAHVVSVRALDPAGNEGSAAVNFTVDATFPTVSITTPASGLATSDATPTIGFTANGSGALTVECKVDSGAFAACTSGGSLATLADGQHTLTVRVTDPLARVVTADRTFTVDTSAPAINFASPANGAVAQGPALDVSFGVSDATSVSLTCSVDSSPPAACSSPFSTGALSDGPHGVTVNMVDAAGNVAAGNVNFTIDSTAPALTIGSPSAGATVTTAVATVVFGATDSTAVSYQCAVDGGSPQPCASPYVPAIAAGSRTVTVYAFDAAGNSTSQVLNFTFAPPAPAPDASPSTPPVGGAQTYSATLTAKKKAGKLRLSLKLTPPAGVSAACAGTVSFSGKMLRVKVGGTAVLKSVAGACVAMRVAKVKKTLKGKLKLTATFAGSAQIAPVKTSKTFKVK